MMFLELAKRRQSCRAYAETPVKREDLISCLEAARLAPSACNSQPWRYIAVTENELAQEMAGCVYDGVVPINRFAKQVGTFVVVIERPITLANRIVKNIKDQKYAQMDIGLSVANFCLQACELGLGTCIMGWFNERKIKKLLGIPKDMKVRLVIAVGYPKNDEIREKKRLDFDKNISFEKY